MSDKTLVTLADAELDHVAAGTYYKINIVGVFAAVQTNASAQTSINGLTLLSGNQAAVQSNNASVG
jgi:hypothetical protein